MGVAAALAPAAAAPARSAAKPAAEAGRPKLQLLRRSCDCGGEPGLSGHCEACNEARLRPQRIAGAPEAGDVAPPIVHDALRASGQPLDAGTRRAMEPRLGHDFSQVRIHTGPIAEASARAVNAHAYTIGDQVVFGAGQYRPGTAGGDRLLAHELTHVTQQAGASVGYALRIGPANDGFERAASAAALSTGAPAMPMARVQRQVVQRQEADTPVAAAPAAAPPQPAPAADPAPAPEQPGLLSRIGNVISEGADFFWGVLKDHLPAVVIDVVQGIRSKGILGYFRDRLGGLLGRLFGGLGQGGGFIAGLLQTFMQLGASARTIIGALAHNDCKPLFDAIGQLGDTLQAMAGDAWDKIKEFFAPIGDFFSDIWKKFGAPAVDFLSDVAGDVWKDIKSFASQVWDGVKAGGALLGRAWGWLKSQLGIADSDDSQEGLLGWAQRKLGEAWDWIKAKLDPVIGPIKTFAAKVAAILPIDAILNLRETVHEWLHHAGEMVRSLAKPQGVTADQASLRDKILPAIKHSIVALGGKIADAGEWAAGKIGGLVQTVTDMFGLLRANSIVGAFAGAIDWVHGKIEALSQWVQGGVKGLFTLVGQGVAKLAGFVDPVLGVLEKLVSVIGNVVKALPDLVGGSVWRAIPACIRNPIQDFVIQHILSAIPIISTFVKIPDIWGKIKQFVLDFLATVFVKGDLGGAVMMVVRFVLEAAGIKVDLFFSVIGKALDEIDDILMHPLDFLKNVFGALVAGFQKFFDNIGPNLLQGVLDWLLGPLAELGIKVPKTFTVTAVLDLVMQVLGITGAKIRKKLEKAVGPTAFKVLDAAWSWVSTLITKGPAALWEQIKGQLSNLWDMVIGGISAWISTDLIKAGIKQLTLLSNPAGAVIKLLQTIYTTFEFIVTKMNRILSLVDSVLDSIGNIIKGNIGPAADLISGALVKALSSVIAFLADWLGFSNPGDKIREIVEDIQGTVDAALDWLVTQAVSLGRSIAQGLGLSKPDPNEDPKWTAGVAGVTREVDDMRATAPGGEVTNEQLQARFPDWKTRYGFSDLSLKAVANGAEIDGAMSPGKPVDLVTTKLPTGESESSAIPLIYYKPPDEYPASLELTDPRTGGKLTARMTGQVEAEEFLEIEEYKVKQGNPVKLGVELNNRVPVGKPLLRTAGTEAKRGPNQARLRRILARYNYPMSGEDSDHVTDLGFGGEDELDNLWPLKANINRLAFDGGYYTNYKVQYHDKNEGPVKKSLGQIDKKWFRVKGFSTTPSDWPK